MANWRKARKNNPRRKDEWVGFELKNAQNAPLEAHIEELLGRLLVHADRIRALSEQETVEFSCVIYASAPPSLNFNKSVIQRVCQLGASLDMDLFLMGPGND